MTNSFRHSGGITKFSNKSVVIDGHRFPSKLEAQRYCELRLLLRAGKIKNLELQPKFELQPAFEKNGEKYRAIYYVADFRYEMNGRVIIEDTKGYKTPEFIMKKKLFEFKYPDLHIIEVIK